MSEQKIELTAESATAPADLSRFQNLALGAGVLGVAACALGAAQQSTQFLQSYLVSYLFWLSISLGCLGLLMINHMSSGSWGLVVRRVTEAGALCLGALLVLFTPIYLGMDKIFPWVTELANDPVIQKKAWFLNTSGFTWRLFLYFAILLGLAWMLRRYSLQQDENPQTEQIVGMRKVSAPGILVMMLVITGMAVDWMMALDPHWYSSLYGPYFAISCLVAGLAFIIIMGRFLANQPALERLFPREVFHDYGKLMLAFVLVWAYFTASQLIIIWSGNLPEEIVWYKHRIHGGWLVMSVLIGFLHFGLPFLMLLSRPLKRSRHALALFACYMLLVHWLDYYWQVGPNFYEHFTFHWLDFAALLAVGGLWCGTFFFLLRRRPVVPFRDPYLGETSGHA